MVDAVAEVFEAFVEVDVGPCSSALGGAGAVHYCELDHLDGVALEAWGVGGGASLGDVALGEV